MPYSIVLTNGSVLTNIADTTADNTTSLTLVGRNYPGYGAIIANNFVHLLENASSASPPATPLAGQLWWDSGNSQMKVWTGTNTVSTVSANTWYSLTTGVSSVLGNTGNITFAQLTSAGLAPINSPAFTGVPLAPTPPLGTNSNQVATAQFVLNQLGTVVGGVSSVLGTTGNITLAQLINGGVAPLGSPQLSGIPTAPTPNVGTNNNQIATTAYVINEVGSLSTGVSSVVGITGNVTLDQLDQAGLCLKSGAAFSGTVTAPTAAQGTNTNQIATCAFVHAAVTGNTPNTRTRINGAIIMWVSPSGNDSTATGSQSSPYATMQAAYNYVANNYDGAGGMFTIMLMPGTHTSGLSMTGELLGFPGGVTVEATTGQGAPGQAQYLNTATIVSVANANCFTVTKGAHLTAQGFTVTAPSGSNTLAAQTGNCFTIIGAGANFNLGPSMIFGAAGGSHIMLQAGAVGSTTSSYTINGGANFGHIVVAEASFWTHTGYTSNATVTISGNPAISTFAFCGSAGYLAIISVTYNGTCVGTKFSVSNGGTLSVNGAGLNYLPGTIAGTGNALIYGGGYYG